MADNQTTNSFLVTWSGSDEGAGIKDYTIYVSENGGPFKVWLNSTTATSGTFTGQGGKTYAFYSIARDQAGNLEAAKNTPEATIRIVAETTDATPPVITPTISGTSGSNGWYTSNVTVSWNVADNESQVTAKAGCDPSTVTADTSGVTFTCSATSSGGTASNSVTIKRDATAPTIIAVATTSSNSNGWYNSNVTIHFTCNDAGSGVAGTCPADEVLSAEGDSVSSTAQTITDQAGNTSAPSNVITVKIDKTPPTCTASATPNLLWPPNNKLVNITTSVEANDTGSGSNGFTLTGVTSSEPGTDDIQGWAIGTPDTAGQLHATRLGSGSGRIYTLSYQTQDKAGNTNPCSTTVTVPHDQGK